MGDADTDSRKSVPNVGITAERSAMDPEFKKILLYVPNVIGYIRIFLLFLAYFQWLNPTYFMPLYLVSMGLDYFDGWAARKFKQCSSFGAWLDVIIDNLSRGLLWANLFQWGWIIVSLEWITFVGNHYEGGAKWREVSETTPPPYIVQRVMANGFKTPIGTWAISGLHILPIWIYAMRNGCLYPYITVRFSITILIILISGRLLSLACELWCIQRHVKSLLLEDVLKASDPEDASVNLNSKSKRH